MKGPFKEGVCHFKGCYIPVLITKDKLPLCSKHRKHLLEDAVKKVPKLQKLSKPTLYSLVVNDE